MNKIINLTSLPEVFRVSQLLKTNRSLTMRSLNYALNNYLKQKKLIKIKRDLYSKTADPFYVASAIYNGYIGFSSALYLYRLKTEIENEIQICVPSNKPKTKFMDKTIVPINMADEFFGTSFEEVSGNTILVSTFPKTVFDMFYRPRHANYHDLYRALNTRRLTEADWNKLLYYAKSSNLATIRRIGYGLEKFAPERFLKTLNAISKKGGKTAYFFGDNAVNYNSKWGIFDSLNIKRWENAV